jgi:hypothetical protein
MPFHIGKGAIEAGYEVGIVLANDASFEKIPCARVSLAWYATAKIPASVCRFK